MEVKLTMKNNKIILIIIVKLVKKTLHKFKIMDNFHWVQKWIITNQI